MPQVSLPRVGKPQFPELTGSGRGEAFALPEISQGSLVLEFLPLLLKVFV